MTSQHPALILAEQCDLEDVFERMCAAELIRQHAENEALKAKLLNATKSALDHVQRNRDLEAMLAAVGAGGVGPLMPHDHSKDPRWPRNASEVRDFLGGHCAAMRYARDDYQPDEDDSYTLSTHDFLTAVYWWADVLPNDLQPQVRPLTDEQIDEILVEAALVPVVPVYKTLARAVEAAHGIKEGV